MNEAEVGYAPLIAPCFRGCVGENQDVVERVVAGYDKLDRFRQSDPFDQFIFELIIY